MTVEETIKSYLRSLAPHIAHREAAQLLRQAANEIERLKRGDFTEDELQKLFGDKNPT